MEPHALTGLSEAKQRLLSSYFRGKMRLPCEGNLLSGVASRTRGGTLPQSFNQQQIWTHIDRIGDKPAYNELITIHRYGPLDIRSLECAFDEMNRRHEIWRTTFAMDEGSPIQVVHDASARVSLRLFDLRSRSRSSRAKESRRLSSVNANEKFDLSILPLWRAILVQVGDEDFDIHLNLHHMVCDGVSVYQIIVPELAALYHAFSQTRPSNLPEPRAQYADFSVWQRAHLTQESLALHLQWWRRKLAGSPLLAWPGGKRRPAVQSFHGATQVLTFTSQTIDPIRAFAKLESATLFMALASGFFALLSRYTGQTDLTLGIPVAGRPCGTEEVMGYFVNPLPVRMDLAGDPSFREVLLRVRSNVLDVLEHGSVPLAQILDCVRPPWDLSRNPLFQIMISLQPSMSASTVVWDVTQADVSSGSTKMDLYLNLEESKGGIRASIAYNPDLLSAPAVRRMFNDWRSILEGGIAQPDRRISELGLRRNARRLMGWLKSKAPEPNKHEAKG